MFSRGGRFCVGVGSKGKTDKLKEILIYGNLLDSSFVVFIFQEALFAWAVMVIG